MLKGLLLASLSAALLCAQDELLRRAKNYIDRQQFEAAEPLLSQALRHDPQNLSLRYQLGYVLFRQRRLAQARAEFEAVVKAAPPALYSRYFLGRIALLEGRPRDAVAWLEPVMAQPVLDAAEQLAKAYLENGQPDRALPNAQAAVRQAPWDGSRRYLLGRIYRRLGQDQAAAEEFRASRRLQAADREAVEQLQQCSQHLARGEKTQALAIRQRLLSGRELDPDALVALGLLFAGAGLEQEALAPFQAAWARQPDWYSAAYNTGLTLLRLGRTAEAEAALEKAVGLLPQSFDANAALALAYVNLGQHERAIAPLQAASRLQPHDVRIAGLLAMAYLRTGAPAKAVPVLRGALPAAQDAKLHLLLLQCLRDDAAKLEVAADGARRFPQSSQAQLALARELTRIGRYQDALPVFDRAAALDPRSEEAAAGVGEVLAKKGDYAGSLAAYRRALALDANNLDAQLGAAKDLVLLRRFAEARQALEAALPRHPDSATLHFELARVYARLGDSARAAEQTRLFEQLKPTQ